MSIPISGKHIYILLPARLSLSVIGHIEGRREIMQLNAIAEWPDCADKSTHSCTGATFHNAKTCNFQIRMIELLDILTKQLC